MTGPLPPFDEVKGLLVFTRPAFDMILLMEEILHQLICSFSHYLQGLYIPGGAGFIPSTVFHHMIHTTSLCIITINNITTARE